MADRSVLCLPERECVDCGRPVKQYGSSLIICTSNRLISIAI